MTDLRYEKNLRITSNLVDAETSNVNTSKPTRDPSRKSFLVRTAVVLVLSAAGLFGVIQIQASINNTSLYYKVFVNGKYVGTVKHSQEEKNRIQAMNDKNQTNIILLPVYQQLKDKINEAEVSIAINNALNPKVKAVKIRLNGRDGVIVKDVLSAQQVIDSIKSRFNIGNQIKEIKVNQKIEFQTVLISKNEVLSLDEAVSRLLGGVEKPKKYLVSRGDSLWTIAARNNVPVEKIKKSNPNIKDENLLQEGQEISINTVDSMITVETVEEVTRTQTYPFETVFRDDPTINKGEQRVLTEGKNGEKLQRVHARKKNGNVYAEVVLSEQIIKEKVDRVIIRGTKEDQATAFGDWIWPVGSRIITSPYGEKRGSKTHQAMDIAAPSGNAVYASNNGTVIYAGWDGGYGKTIRIRHGNGIVSTYAHLSTINVSVGQKVTKGSVIGGVGSTGNSTGPHLHYEVRINGTVVNPQPYM